MPPTIQTAVNSGDKRPGAPPAPPRPLEKKLELISRVKYCNTLPDIPFDPKFVTYPFESTRFIQNNPTSLERNYKYEVLAEHDLGVTIDLINSDTYAHDLNAVLSPFDEKLLEEDILTPQDSRRSRHHARSVSWLRRTEYISTEQTRFQPQTMDKVEAKVGYSIKKSLKDDTLYMDRDSQIQAIEKTFEDAKIPIEKHYSVNKANVVPVEVLPIYPDFKVWKYPCAQVIFDSDPAPVGRPIPAQIEEMSQAMIRGVMDESGEQFVAYFLPTEETMERRKADVEAGQEYDEEIPYTYRMAREYNWNVKSKATKGYEENYFLVVRNDGVFYNELETRVRLNKRRQKQGQAQASNTKLLVKHRVLNAQEFQMQRYREKMLEPPGEEEEEEEEEEEDEEEANKSGEEGEQAAGDKEEKMETDGEKDDSDKDSNKSDSDNESGSGKGSKKASDESDKESEKSAKGSEKSAKGSDHEASDHEASAASGDEAEKKDDGETKGKDSPAGSPAGSAASSASSSGSSSSGSGSDSD